MSDTMEVKNTKSADLVEIDPSRELTPMSMINTALIAGADVETLDRLMTLQERFQASEAKALYDKGMASLQKDLPIIKKNREGYNSVKYADWGQIKKTIQPALNKHGFAITHRTKVVDKTVEVTAICSNKYGHREETTLPIPFDTTGNKNAVQAIGSSTAYGIRYTGCAILGIATEDAAEDDDGGKGLAQCERVVAIREAKTDEELSELRVQYKDDRNKKEVITNDEWTAILEAFQARKE